jgi:hypothetical protein
VNDLFFSISSDMTRILTFHTHTHTHAHKRARARGWGWGWGRDAVQAEQAKTRKKALFCVRANFVFAPFFVCVWRPRPSLSLSLSLRRMASCVVKGAQPLDNPTAFTNDFQFEITVECISPLTDGPSSPLLCRPFFPASPCPTLSRI